MRNKTIFLVQWLFIIILVFFIVQPIYHSLQDVVFWTYFKARCLENLSITKIHVGYGIYFLEILLVVMYVHFLILKDKTYFNLKGEEGSVVFSIGIVLFFLACLAYFANESILLDYDIWTQEKALKLR